MIKKTYICKYCMRKIIKDFITKNGCRWCDAEYHAKLKRKKNENLQCK